MCILVGCTGNYWGSSNKGEEDNIGIMFLAEAALGNEKHINRDDHTLTKPPENYHSVVAKGRQEPGNAEFGCCSQCS